MEIIRVQNNYKELFKEEHVNKQNAFIVVDDVSIYTYVFEICDIKDAIVYYENEDYVDQVINEFRFYSTFVVNFYDKDHRLIKKFDDVKLKKIPIVEIQPSQLCISIDKLNRVLTWANKETNLVIPIYENNGIFIATDGHTRLKALELLGVKDVYVYLDSDESGKYINDFVKFANENNIYKVHDMPIVSSDDYNCRWVNFCNDYFKKTSELENI